MSSAPARPGHRAGPAGECHGEGLLQPGVSNGDVSARSAILWGHTTRAGEVTLEVSKYKSFRGALMRKRLSARAGDRQHGAGQGPGLKPGKRYWFRFVAAAAAERNGTFKTAPSTSSKKTDPLRVVRRQGLQPAARADQARTGTPAGLQPHGRPSATTSTSSSATRSTRTARCRGSSRSPLTVKQKWAKYRLNMGLPTCSALRGSAPYYAHWDDHEFVNDFSPQENSSRQQREHQRPRRSTRRAPRPSATTRRSPTQRNGLYRSFRWGKNLEVFFLDERSFRSAKAGAATSATTRRPASPTSRRPRRSARATSSRSWPPSLAQPVSPHASPRSTTPTAPCSAPASSRASRARSSAPRRR